MTLQEIAENFELLDEWEDRYRYVIELGRDLEPLDETERSDANKVHGCVSQVWVATKYHNEKTDTGKTRHLTFKGDSDAHIVRGLIAIIFAIYSGKTADQVLAIEAGKILEQLGLHEHLTPQRSNGLGSMISRIRADAQSVLVS